MHISRFLMVGTILAILVSIGIPAYAQNAPDRTRVELAIGSNVSVMTRDGRTQTGKLGMTSASEVTLVDGRGQRRIPWADIQKIDRNFKVSVLKSTIVGAGIGMIVGGVSLMSGGCTEDAGTFAFDCFAFFGGIGAGAGAVTGAVINAVRAPKPVYRADRRTAISLAPVVSPKRAGVVGTIRW